jgi:hypothetical protein
VPNRKHISRGLRFTLTSAYTVLFTLLLAGVSLLFRHNLVSTLNDQAYDDLNQSWAVVVSNLRIENDRGQANYHPKWFFDDTDPDEAAISARIKSIYMVADQNGKPLLDQGEPSYSSTYQSLGFDTPEQVRRVLGSGQPTWLTKKDPHGVPDPRRLCTERGPFAKILCRDRQVLR